VVFIHLLPGNLYSEKVFSPASSRERHFADLSLEKGLFAGLFSEKVFSPASLREGLFAGVILEKVFSPASS
jgi:hypothetical protein